jgi:parallel beta-helix repeat protein
MSPVERIRDLPYPEDLQGVPEIKEYLKRLYAALQEEQSERIEDFDQLKLDNVPWIDVRTYGAKGDGSTNDTVAIKAAIDSLSSTGGTVFLPPGDYNMSTPTNVDLISHLRLCGSGDYTKITCTGGTLNRTTPNAIFDIDGKHDIEISNLTFVGDANKVVAIKVKAQSYNISVHNNTTHEMGLLHASPAGSFTYNYDDSLASESISYNIFANDNRGYGDSSLVPMSNDNSVSFITLLYCKDSRANRNYAEYFEHVVWAYGGAPHNEARTSASGNTKWCRNIQLNENITKHTFSGVWMCNALNSQLNNNIVEDTTDVGVDFEGCDDCVADGNVLTNAGGGGLTALFECNNIIFSNSTIRMNVGSDPGADGHNAILVRDGNSNITFKDIGIFVPSGESVGLIEIWKNGQLGEGTTWDTANKNIELHHLYGENFVIQALGGTDGIKVKSCRMHHSLKTTYTKIIDIVDSINRDIADNHLSCGQEGDQTVIGDSPIHVREVDAATYSTADNKGLTIRNNVVADHANLGIGTFIGTVSIIEYISDNHVEKIMATTSQLDAYNVRLGNNFKINSQTAAAITNHVGTVYTGWIEGERDASDTWDPGEIADSAEAEKEVTVTGAALGDFAVASLSVDTEDLGLSAVVSGTNTVSVSLFNNTGGASDINSGDAFTVYVKVIKK